MQMEVFPILLQLMIDSCHAGSEKCTTLLRKLEFE
jgi:hypothetical protein